MDKKLNQLKDEEAGGAVGQSKTFQRFEYQAASGYNAANDFVSAGQMLGSRTKGEEAEEAEEEPPKMKKKKKQK